jgi:hypothetical protein
VVSACTLAVTPMFANAPRNIPQGNHRNCTQPSIISVMGSRSLARGVGFLQAAPSPPRCYPLQCSSWKTAGSYYLSGRRPPSHTQQTLARCRIWTWVGVGGMGRYPMVRLQVVDLFPEHDHPQVFTNELDNIERLDHACAISRKPSKKMIAISFAAPPGVLGGGIPLHKSLPHFKP